MKPVIYSAILEIEGEPNGKDRRRYLKTLADIRKATVEKGAVIDVLVQDGNNQGCRVKHFRYNYLCKDGCDHKVASYGVLRYFGLTLVIDSNLALGGIYKPNYYSELTICGMTMSYGGVRFEMERVPAEIKQRG